MNGKKLNKLPPSCFCATGLSSFIKNIRPVEFKKSSHLKKMLFLADFISNSNFYLLLKALLAVA
jgi:hypothetical protein